MIGEIGANASSKLACSAASRSASPAAMPRSASEVTPCSAMPQGTMPEKCSRSGATLMASPCMVTQRRTRTPMAAIFCSDPGGALGHRRHRLVIADEPARTLPFHPHIESPSRLSAPPRFGIPLHPLVKHGSARDYAVVAELVDAQR